MSASKNKFISIADRLLSAVLSEKYIEEFLGDLHEIYEDRKYSQGLLIANLLYWLDAMHLYMGFGSFHFFSNHQNPTIMLRHYFTISFRTIVRNKTSSLMSIFGLMLGVGVCLLICQYVYFESGYDQFHEKSDQKYRLIQNDFRGGNDLGSSAYTTYALGERCRENIPEVLQSVRIRPMEIDPIVSNVDKQIIFQQSGLFYVDPNFLEFFDFQLLYGSREGCLVEKHSIVITEKLAHKYFANEKPIGKSLKISAGVYGGDFEVTAVLKDIPANSHLQFDMLINLGYFLDVWPSSEGDKGWVNADFITYLSFVENIDLNVTKEKLNAIVDEFASERLTYKEITRKIDVQPVADIHLHSAYLKEDFVKNNGRVQNINYFILIGIFIILMAWVNYINLYTARAVGRSKEVGIRKSMGAFRRQLIGQFLTESLVINIIAVILAIGLAYCLLPLLSNITGNSISFQILFVPMFWVWFVLIVIAGSILSGFYPAFILSSFKPISIIKSSDKRRDRIGFRRGLIAFQFIISGALISSTYLVYKQIHFLRNKDLGIDAEKILVIDGPRVVLESLKSEGVTLGSKYKAFKSLVGKHHSVSHTTTSSSIPSKDYLFSDEYRKRGDKKTSKKKVDIVLVDSDFFETYDLDVLVYDSILSHESSVEQIFINEKALALFGFQSAASAIHEQLINSGEAYEIVGVIKNVDWDSPRYEQKPIIFYINEEWGHYLSIRLNLSEIPASLAYVEKSFKEVFPNDPFSYFFLEDAFNNQYRADLQFGKLLNAFTVIAIFISCLGLFALVTYSVSVRVKEIGIRKVFGANVASIILLLSKEYIIVLCISILLTIPIIQFGGNYWLTEFANKVEIGLDIFIIPAAILMLLSTITVAYKIYGYAKTNPVNSLRTE